MPIHQSLSEWCKENNKQFILDEWDTDKNEALGLSPDSVGSKSRIKVWWLCPQGHSYDSVVYNRTNNVKNGNLLPAALAVGSLRSKNWQAWFPRRPPSLAHRRPPSRCLFPWLSTCVLPPLVYVFPYKGTVMSLEHTLMSSF